MKIENIVFPLPLKEAGGCIEVDEPRKQTRKRLNWGGTTWSAYRLSYRLNCEEIPRSPPSLKEGIILHSCDNQWCVDPDHLSMGTAKRNMQERSDRNVKWRENVSKAVKQQWSELTGEKRNLKLRGIERTRKDVPRENHSGRFRRNSL